MAMSNLVKWAFHCVHGNGKKWKQRLVACDLNVGRYRQLIELMKLCEYSRCHFLTLIQDHLHIKN